MPPSVKFDFTGHLDKTGRMGRFSDIAWGLSACNLALDLPRKIGAECQKAHLLPIQSKTNLNDLMLSRGIARTSKTLLKSYLRESHLPEKTRIFLLDDSPRNSDQTRTQFTGDHQPENSPQMTIHQHITAHTATAHIAILMALSLHVHGHSIHPERSTCSGFSKKPGFFLCIVGGYCYTRPRDLFLLVGNGAHYLFTDYVHRKIRLTKGAANELQKTRFIMSHYERCGPRSSSLDDCTRSRGL